MSDFLRNTNRGSQLYIANSKYLGYFPGQFNVRIKYKLLHPVANTKSTVNTKSTRQHLINLRNFPFPESDAAEFAEEVKQIMQEYMKKRMADLGVSRDASIEIGRSLSQWEGNTGQTISVRFCVSVESLKSKIENSKKIELEGRKIAGYCFKYDKDTWNTCIFTTFYGDTSLADIDNHVVDLYDSLQCIDLTKDIVYIEMFPRLNHRLDRLP